jgi:rare lipoprotein A
MPWRVDRAGSLAFLCLMLASCALPDRPRTAKPRAGRDPVSRPVPDEPVKIGKPYVIGGITYTPRDEPRYDQVGLASWYGSESGNHTANGERFRPNWISAAHKTLPLPSYVEVTALATGRTILLRVNDRGPFVTGRIIDLSRGAAETLGLLRSGTTAVRVRRVDPPERDRLALRTGRIASPRPSVMPQPFYAPLPAPLPRSQPVLPPQSLPQPPEPQPQPRPPLILDLPPPEVSASRQGWYVQVGSFANRGYADSFVEQLSTIGRASVAPAGTLWRARIGPYDEPRARSALAQVQARGYQGAMLVRPAMTP